MKKLRLNELEQFRKSSSRLVLEAHSHCEVPAGCGGVVLRWRNAEGPTGLRLSHYLTATLDALCIDGIPQTEPRFEVSPGLHVLSFLALRPPPTGFLMLALEFHPHLESVPHRELTAGPGGPCVATWRQPPREWRSVDFDDSSWVPLCERSLTSPAPGDTWRHEALKRRGAPSLGLPPESWREAERDAQAADAGPLSLWLRWRFRVTAEGLS